MQTWQNYSLGATFSADRKFNMTSTANNVFNQQ
jgi:hypothetical protein